MSLSEYYDRCADNHDYMRQAQRQFCLKRTAVLSRAVLLLLLVRGLPAIIVIIFWVVFKSGFKAKNIGFPS